MYSIKEGDLDKPTSVKERERGLGRKQVRTSRKRRKDRKSRINSTENRRAKNKKESGGEKDEREK